MTSKTSSEEKRGTNPFWRFHLSNRRSMSIKGIFGSDLRLVVRKSVGTNEVLFLENSLGEKICRFHLEKSFIHVFANKAFQDSASLASAFISLGTGHVITGGFPVGDQPQSLSIKSIKEALKEELGFSDEEIEGILTRASIIQSLKGLGDMSSLEIVALSIEGKLSCPLGLCSHHKIEICCFYCPVYPSYTECSKTCEILEDEKIRDILECSSFRIKVLGEGDQD
jgi:hypothetical protein